jgi:hypothetical protein
MKNLIKDFALETTFEKECFNKWFNFEHLIQIQLMF